MCDDIPPNGIIISISGPMTDFERIDIHELLPQREPFVMVGRLLHFDMKRTVTATIPSAGNLFVNDGHFSAEGVMENIAQTCAARIGYINKYILGKSIQIGLIGGIRNFRIHRLPSVGEEIITAIDTVEEVMGMTMVEGTVTSGGTPIAECVLKIALMDTEETADEETHGI